MAKNEILKISDFQSLGLCDGFAKVESESSEDVAKASGGAGSSSCDWLVVKNTDL